MTLPTEQQSFPGGTPQDPMTIRRPLFHPAVFGLLVLVLVFFTYQLVGGVIQALLFGIDINDGNVQQVRAITIASQFLFLLLPAVLALRVQRWGVRESLRLKAPRVAPLVLIVVCVVALQFVFQGYMEAQTYVLKNYVIPPSIQPLLKKLEEFIEGIYLKLLVMRSPAELFYVWLVIAVTPAICEEGLFRGVAQTAFEKGFGMRWAVVVSGGIFALFHLNPFSFVPLILLGMLFSVAVQRTGSLAAGIAAHLANNSFAVFSIYFSGGDAAAMHDLSVGPYVLTSVWFTVLALLVFAAAFMLFWKSTRPSPILP
jgi:membrane protease YdiL (CAAX protease family)